jgi:glycosyltransferase involved in cell wall biosynthesis
MIVFAHLLNDRSGSPRVLSSVMAALAERDSRQVLYLGHGGDGFLGEAVPQARRYAYRRGGHRWATLWRWLVSQADLLWKLWRAQDIDRDAVLYVNTLLPFAAAVYGRLSGRRVVWHVHEASLQPLALQRLLLAVVRWGADAVICVSEFHRHALNLPRAYVVRNAVDEALFTSGTRSVYQPWRDGVFRVCMLCSLRDYKGVPEFLRLARAFEGDAGLRFVLVASDDADAVRAYVGTHGALSRNLQVERGVANVSAVYAQAGLVVNLSRVDMCQETFGLTLLEAMAFGVPVIAPPVGGPVELVEEGVQGYLVDSRNADALQAAVARLAGDAALCLRLSAACRRRAQELSPAAFRAAVCSVVYGAQR